jgi:hypothetical protein
VVIGASIFDSAVAIWELMAEELSELTEVMGHLYEQKIPPSRMVFRLGGQSTAYGSSER